MRIHLSRLLLLLFILSIVINLVHARRTEHKSVVRIVGRTCVFFLVVSIFVIVILCILPAPSIRYSPHIAPARSFENAVEMFQDYQRDEKKFLIQPQHQSILLHHGGTTPHVLVCFHGSTMSPDQWMEFAQPVYQQGINVLILREPHHAILNQQYAGDQEGTWTGNSVHLDEITPESLCQYADVSINISAGLGRKIHVIGISMGGILCSWVAFHRPDVAKIVMLAPAFQMHPTVLKKWQEDALVNFLSRVIVNTQGTDYVGYDNPSYNAIAAFLRLGRSIQETARSSRVVVKNITVIYNENDDKVENSAIRQFIDHIDDIHPTVHVIEKSLNVPHDAIDRHWPAQKIGIVYPLLWSHLRFD